MPQQSYLSDIALVDGGFEPVINGYLTSERIDWFASDLRTKEQQLTANGKMMVTVTVTQAQHVAIKAITGTLHLTVPLFITELQNELGAEGFDNLSNPSDLIGSMLEIADERQRRFGAGRR